MTSSFTIQNLINNIYLPIRFLHTREKVFIRHNFLFTVIDHKGQSTNFSVKVVFKLLSFVDVNAMQLQYLAVARKVGT